MQGLSHPYLVTRSSDGHNFVNLEERTYTAKSGKVYLLPIGAQSDGASIPRELWALCAPFGRHWMPAFFHDHNYRGTFMTKEEADDLFLEMMLYQGVPAITAHLIYDGVRVGGQSSFEEDRKLEAADPVAG